VECNFPLQAAAGPRRLHSSVRSHGFSLGLALCADHGRTMLSLLLAVSLPRAGALGTTPIPPPNPQALLEGSWEGTERCAEHCCTQATANRGSNHKSKPHCQGTVRATLAFGAGGNGTYSIDGLVISSEFRGNFAAGHVQASPSAAPHGTFIAQANATHLYGSWISFGSRRLFHWDFTRSTPPPPPPPPCTSAKSAQLCRSETGCAWRGGSCTSRILQQVNAFVGGTVAPWGTTYSCFRVPSSVQLPNGDVVIFVESRIGSCGDQAPKDVTMKRSTDRGLTWGPLTLVVGPTSHIPGKLDFSARNPYATLDKNGELLLSWVNSTVPKAPSADISWQRRSTDGGRTWGVDYDMKLGKLGGTLLGPGEGIVLGRHAPQSRYKGRIVICGATGYVGNIPGGQSMPVFTSDDDGKTYQTSHGSGSVQMPFKGLAECQVVELNNGSVMVNARNELGAAAPPSGVHHRAYAISDDGGSTFGAYQFSHDLIDPTCMAGLINFHGALYFSNPATTSGRTHMTLKKSLDQGASWQEVALVYAGPAAYSLVVPLTNTSIGVVYERNGPGTKNMTVAIVDVSA
jgi:sialidase-1